MIKNTYKLFNRSKDKKTFCLSYLMLFYCCLCFGQQKLTDKVVLEPGIYDYKLYYQDQSESLVLSEKSGSNSHAEDLLTVYHGIDSSYLHMDIKASGTVYKLTLAYDKFRELFVLTSLDSTTAMIDIYQEDNADKEAIILTNVKSGTHYVDNSDKKIHTKITLEDLKEASFTMLIEASKDLGESWFLQAKYEFLKR